MASRPDSHLLLVSSKQSQTEATKERQSSEREAGPSSSAAAVGSREERDL